MTFYFQNESEVEKDIDEIQGLIHTALNTKDGSVRGTLELVSGQLVHLKTLITQIKKNYPKLLILLPQLN